MGSSLSAEEELFVSFRWDQLLTEVEEGRHNVREEHNSNDDDDDDDDDDVAPTGTSSASKKKGFSLSLEEWQALLSLLECKDSAPSAAASLLCERLTAEELRCPLVALTVHVCLWWSGSITEDVLLSRLDGLQHLMEEVEATHTNTQTHSDAQPSRRQRLLQSVRTRISLPRRGGSTPPFFGSTQDVYCGMDLVRAVQQHRSQSSPVADRGGMDARRCQYLDLMEVANGTTQPVMCVCWRLFLAALACLAPHLSLSEEGIEQLRHLAIAFRAHNRAQHTNNEDELLPMMTKQTVVAALEVALVELQYKTDVCEVMGSDGARLANELNDARLGREKLAHQATGTSSSSSSSSSPTARWDACMSQFIGQRHIWRALRNQFLSADVFDSAKPTVIIFFGPSGYGKSEMAKQIASALHGCTVAALEPLGKLIHIHMPSFCTKDSIYSLVDPPAAHIGDGMLLSALLQHKDAVVVLDEFEKSTAEAIQNLWLSAFQKDGTLRSLKDAARSVSTVKATFILTCNVVAEAINERAGLYLSATAEDQARMRAIYETMCRGVCRDVFGEPFVNRVDFFFPFVPYSVAERRSFVVMQLERCMAAQAAKGRTLHITPRFVAAMAVQLTSFHATTVEEIFRPLILHMANRGWQRAVLTVEHRSTSAIRSNNHSNNDDDDDVPSFYWRGMDKFVVMAAVDEAEGRCWAQLEGGEACLARWASPLETQPSKEEEAPRTSQPSTKDVVVEPTHKTEIGGLSAASEGLRQRRVTAGGGGMEMAMRTDVDLHTQRETELEVEVNTLRELLVHKDAEIERLTGKTLVLQRCMGLVMCMSAAMAVLLYTMVGMQMMIFFAILSGLTMAVLLKLPLAVLLQSLRVLYAFLGPVRSAILLGVVAVWMALASRKVLYCR